MRSMPRSGRLPSGCAQSPALGPVAASASPDTKRARKLRQSTPLTSGTTSFASLWLKDSPSSPDDDADTGGASLARVCGLFRRASLGLDGPCGVGAAEIRAHAPLE